MNMTDGNSSSRERGIANRSPQFVEDSLEFPKISFRPARMGWFGYPPNGENDILSTPDELQEANQFASKMLGLVRVGFQIPSYALDRKSGAESFTGLTFPGYVDTLSSALNYVSGLKKVMPNAFTFLDHLKFKQIADLPVNLGINLFKGNLEDATDTVAVLGIPVAETNHGGYPPLQGWLHRSKSSITDIHPLWGCSI